MSTASPGPGSHELDLPTPSGARAVTHHARPSSGGAASTTGRGDLLDWILRLVPAAILGQTLPFKLAGAELPVWIFTRLGAEPWGRLLTGGLELVAVVLLLRGATSAWGALLTLGLMGGAIMSHLAVLGIEVQGDGGGLFALANVAGLFTLALAWRRRRELPLIGARFGG